MTMRGRRTKRARNLGNFKTQQPGFEQYFKNLHLSGDRRNLYLKIFNTCDIYTVIFTHNIL